MVTHEAKIQNPESSKDPAVRSGIWKNVQESELQWIRNRETRADVYRPGVTK